jgi:hypothetical protein
MNEAEILRAIIADNTTLLKGDTPERLKGLSPTIVKSYIAAMEGLVNATSDSSAAGPSVWTTNSEESNVLPPPPPPPSTPSATPSSQAAEDEDVMSVTPPLPRIVTVEVKEPFCGRCLGVLEEVAPTCLECKRKINHQCTHCDKRDPAPVRCHYASHHPDGKGSLLCSDCAMVCDQCQVELCQDCGRTCSECEDYTCWGCDGVEGPSRLGDMCPKCEAKRGKRRMTPEQVAEVVAKACGCTVQLQLEPPTPALASDISHVTPMSCTPVSPSRFNEMVATSVRVGEYVTLKDSLLTDMYYKVMGIVIEKEAYGNVFYRAVIRNMYTKVESQASPFELTCVNLPKEERRVLKAKFAEKFGGK